MTPVVPDSKETSRLLRALSEGRDEVFPLLFERHRGFLEHAIRKRLDPRLLVRADSSDVFQETQLEALQRMDDYLCRRPMPFRLWLLKTACEQIRRIERRHLSAAKRSVDRQIPLPDASSMQLAAIARENPGVQVERREITNRVRSALTELSEQDREIVMLRNFEDLTNAEVAVLLEISPGAARKRYARALLRLQALLGGGFEEGCT